MSLPAITAIAGRRRVPVAVNEPIRNYAAGSTERAALKARLASMASEHIEIPVIVNGKEYRTGDTEEAVMPHAHRHVLATWHKATPELVQEAIASGLRAREEWGSWPWEDRATVFLRAAELLSTTWRDTINAATILNQSKTTLCKCAASTAHLHRVCTTSSRSTTRASGIRPTTARSRASSMR
jgi:1-pyrroline-5-carboxylate dehydrogenase